MFGETCCAGRNTIKRHARIVAGKLPRVIAQFTGHILLFRHRHSVVRFVLYIIYTKHVSS